MHDLRWLRDNPDAFDRNLARRGAAPASARLLELDREKRALETRVQEDQALRNRLSKEIGASRGADGKPAADVLERMARLKDDLKSGEVRLRELDERLKAELSGLPNLLADDVPEGPDESFNREERRWGEPRRFDHPVRAHDEIGPALGLDLERAAMISGARFAVLTGQLARLERALGQFMLDLQTLEHGYTEVAPPLLVRGQALYGTGQLPKFGDDLFRTTDDRWLIPTAEVPLTNLVADRILDEESLPLRFAAWTPCFRSEAGAAGRDTRGIVRQHQFWKVEMVSVTAPEGSEEEHRRMTGCAEAVLQKLDLPYRVMTLAAGDTDRKSVV